MVGIFEARYVGQALNNHISIGFAVGAWAMSVVLSHVVVGPQLNKSLSIYNALAFVWLLNVLYMQEYIGLVCIVQV